MGDERLVVVVDVVRRFAFLFMSPSLLLLRVAIYITLHMHNGSITCIYVRSAGSELRRCVTHVDMLMCKSCLSRQSLIVV
jgi:hypothetical protein